MKKIIKQILILACLLAIIILPYFVFAASTPLDNLEGVGTTGGYAEAGSATVSMIAGTIVGAVLSLLGIIFVILIVYAGLLWMTAQGNEEQVTKAKTILRNSIIGLILTVSAFAIYAFISAAFL